jgi:hypothetical protein
LFLTSFRTALSKVAPGSVSVISALVEDNRYVLRGGCRKNAVFDVLRPF